MHKECKKLNVWFTTCKKLAIKKGSPFALVFYKVTDDKHQNACAQKLLMEYCFLKFFFFKETRKSNYFKIHVSLHCLFYTGFSQYFEAPKISINRSQNRNPRANFVDGAESIRLRNLSKVANVCSKALVAPSICLPLDSDFYFECEAWKF